MLCYDTSFPCHVMCFFLSCFFLLSYYSPSLLLSLLIPTLLLFFLYFFHQTNAAEVRVEDLESYVTLSIILHFAFLRSIYRIPSLQYWELLFLLLSTLYISFFLYSFSPLLSISLFFSSLPLHYFSLSAHSLYILFTLFISHSLRFGLSSFLFVPSISFFRLMRRSTEQQSMSARKMSEKMTGRLSLESARCCTLPYRTAPYLTLPYPHHHHLIATRILFSPNLKHLITYHLSHTQAHVWESEAWRHLLWTARTGTYISSATQSVRSPSLETIPPILLFLPFVTALPTLPVHF